MGDAAPLAAGCYGKIPAVGDFFSRRLPTSFISAWDRWLAEVLPHSAQLLGDRWDESYRTAPIWRFALARNAHSATGWAGVLMPSVDRVGRRFPLTLAAPLDNAFQLAQALFAAESWYASLESIALGALMPAAEPEAIDRALLESGFPAADAAGACDQLADDAGWSGMPAGSGLVRLSRVDDGQRVLQTAALAALSSARGWHTFWWTRGRDS